MSKPISKSSPSQARRSQKDYGIDYTSFFRRVMKTTIIWSMYIVFSFIVLSHLRIDCIGNGLNPPWKSSVQRHVPFFDEMINRNNWTMVKTQENVLIISCIAKYNVALTDVTTWKINFGQADRRTMYVKRTGEQKSSYCLFLSVCLNTFALYPCSFVHLFVYMCVRDHTHACVLWAYLHRRWRVASVPEITPCWNIVLERKVL